MAAILHRFAAAALLSFALLWSASAFAWGDTGHRTVCEIALANLTPAARAEVDRLLQAHPAIVAANPLNREFGWACTYPDHPSSDGPGRRSPEHFVNYPRTLAAVTSRSGCGEARLCVLSAIAQDLAILRSPGASDAERAAALVYLGHWLGDVHQPLHSSFRGDQGGNGIDTRGLCRRSLHSAWDTCILEARDTGSRPSIEAVRALAQAWSAAVADSDRAAWLSTEPWQWSAESYAVTLAPEVGYCVMAGGACRYSADRLEMASGQPREVLVDDAYADRWIPVIRQRIAQAGIRLAHRLNLALDPAYRG